MTKIATFEEAVDVLHSENRSPADSGHSGPRELSTSVR